MNAVSFGLGGIQQAEGLLDRTASSLASASVSGGADIPRDVVSLGQAKVDNEASVKVINSATQMEKALLDIFA